MHRDGELQFLFYAQGMYASREWFSVFWYDVDNCSYIIRGFYALHFKIQCFVWIQFIRFDIAINFMASVKFTFLLYWTMFDTYELIKSLILYTLPWRWYLSASSNILFGIFKILYLLLSSFRNLHILKTFTSFYFPVLRMNVSL